MTPSEETSTQELTRDAIKQDPDILVPVYRTGNFGLYLGWVLISKYKRCAVINLVLATMFALLTVVVEGLLYHGMPTHWVRTETQNASVVAALRNF